MRTGVVTKKLGMSALFDASGKRTPVTLLKVDDCMVVGHRKPEKDGVFAMRVGHGQTTAKKLSKPVKGHYQKNNLPLRRHIVDFRVSEDAGVDVGTTLHANHFVKGQFIDATGTSTGKGFAGTMKRHNFSGLRASHGVSIAHRSQGSTGQNQDPGKVFKGKKMAGHMGDERVTKQNLEVLMIDEENDILVIKGCIPGSKNSYVIVKDAVKKSVPDSAPYPCAKGKTAASSENAEAGSEAGVENSVAEENKAGVSQQVEPREETKAETKAEAPVEEVQKADSAESKPEVEEEKKEENK